MLKETLEKYLEKFDPKLLSEASFRLSELYRSKKVAPQLEPYLNLAYLAVRMPATYEVLLYVFTEAKKRLSPSLNLLDVGSGPGTAIFAASELFPSLDFTLVEKDHKFVEIAQELTKDLSLSKNWIKQDFTTYQPDQHDLIVFSYSLGEISPSQLKTVIQRFWEKCSLALIIVEPGTPKGFETILQARSTLIDLGAEIAAPCPHKETCSLRRDAKTFDDWCHFSVRLTRSFLHRYVKQGSLSYEDEKFSYIIATKKEFMPTCNRILHEPAKRTGHMHLKLCSPQGLCEKTISKRDKELYQLAKKLDWGDDLNLFKT